MGSNTHRYFLCVDSSIVKFPKLPGLTKMDSYVNLSLFTSLYNSEQEVIQALILIGAIEPGKYSHVFIVKRKGNKKDGYIHEEVNEKLLFKNSARFFSEGTIKEFLYSNRENYPVIKRLLELYVKTLNRLLGVFESKIGNLKLDITYAEISEKAKLQNELDRTQDIYESIKPRLSNLKRLLLIIKELESGLANRDVEFEYEIRLDGFVRRETNFMEGRRCVYPNTRGLIRLACEIGDIVELYPDVVLPNKPKKYRNERIALLQAVKSAVAQNSAEKTDEIRSQDSKECGDDGLAKQMTPKKKEDL